MKKAHGNGDEDIDVRLREHGAVDQVALALYVSFELLHVRWTFPRCRQHAFCLLLVVKNGFHKVGDPVGDAVDKIIELLGQPLVIYDASHGTKDKPT